MHKTCELCVVITDRDTVIAAAGVPKKELTDRRVSGELDELMEERTLYAWKTGEKKKTVTEDGGGGFVSCAMPILSSGDVIGSVVSLSPADADRPPQPAEVKLIQTAAVFLGKQLEG